MRRMYSGRGGGPGKSEDGEQGFWPSYADMMSAVALILFFLMLLAYIQNLITGNDLRRKFSLPSTLFDMKLDGDKIIFTGYGHGHGVGMSQVGAKSYAQDGWSHEKILAHYYRGAVLKKVY